MSVNFNPVGNMVKRDRGEERIGRWRPDTAVRNLDIIDDRGE